MRTYGRYSSKIIYLGTGQRRVIDFTIRRPYPEGKIRRKLGGPQNRSMRCTGKKNLLPLLEIET
jgi:hypothetical protein